MGNPSVWLLAAIVATALWAVVVTALRYTRAISVLNIYLRARYPAVYQWSLFSRPPDRNVDLLSRYALYQIVLGTAVPDIQDAQFREPLKAARIAIAGCGIAFLVALIALALIFQQLGLR